MGRHMTVGIEFHKHIFLFSVIMDFISLNENQKWYLVFSLAELRFVKS